MATIVQRDTSGKLLARRGESELTDRRTRGCKVFASRGQHRVVATTAPIHYRRDPWASDDPFAEIDIEPTVAPVSASWDLENETNGWQWRLWAERSVGSRTLRYVAQFRRAGHWLAMAPVALYWRNKAGERELIARPSLQSHLALPEQDAILFPNAFGTGLHFGYRIQASRMQKIVRIRRKSDLPSPHIGTEGLRLCIAMALAWDGEAAPDGFASDLRPAVPLADLDALDTPDGLVKQLAEWRFRRRGRELWGLSRPVGWDGSGRSMPLPWRLLHKGGYVLAEVGVPLPALKGAEYPVTLDTTVNEQVAASGDDSEHADAISNCSVPEAFSYTDTTVRMGERRCQYGISDYDNGGYDGLARFYSVAIPQGATIDSAVVSYKAAGSTGNPTIYYKCEDADSATQITSLAEWNGASWTSAFISDSPAAWSAGTWYDTPDISSPVQEVINRPGWSSNNHLNVLGVGSHTASPGDTNDQYRQWYTYDNASADAPKIEIIYSTAGLSNAKCPGIIIAGA